MKRKALEVLGYLALTGVALALRLIDLDARPFHHDESQDAYFSWLFSKNGDYEYNPLLHGPLRFYLTAGIFELFGASDFTARLAPALMGTLMVPLPYLLRHQVGRVEAHAVIGARQARDVLLHQRPPEVVDAPAQRLRGGVEPHLHPARLQAAHRLPQPGWSGPAADPRSRRLCTGAHRSQS